MAAGLAKESQPEPQSYAKIIEGEIAIQGGDPRAAVTLITDGIKLVDTWIARFQLGRAYLEAGQFPEADSEFDRCLKRRGEALALFLDEAPTYGYYPLAYYYLGRAREGYGASAAEPYRQYLSIREKAGEDPLIADIRKRVK